MIMFKKYSKHFYRVLLAISALVLSLLIANISAFFPAFTLIDVLEKKSYDFRFQWRGKTDTKSIPLVIVAADDHSEIALDKRFPYSRGIWANVIDNLNAAGVKLIIFDIQFATPDDPVGDSTLAESIQRAGNVLLAGELIREQHNLFKETTIFEAPPDKRFMNTGAPWAIVNLHEDVDKVVREYPAYVPVQDGKMYLPIAVRATTLYRGIDISPSNVAIEENQIRIGDLTIPTVNVSQFDINYYGPTGSFPIYSVSQVLDVGDFDLVEGEDSDWMELFIMPLELLDSSLAAIAKENPFRDKIVLIGNTMPAFHDLKATPFDGYDPTVPLMSGVEVHAHSLATILQDNYLKHLTWIFQFLFWFVLAILMWWFTEHRHVWISSILFVGLSIFIIASSTFLFIQFNYISSMVTPLIVVSVNFTSSILLRILREQKEKAKIKGMFGQYVPKKVVGELIANPHLLRLGGERCNLSVLFTDVAGFTSISENLSPEELVGLLNEYLTAMTRIILEEDGIIDKYEGDLIMAEFGAPVHYKEHAIHACRAAIRMQKKLAELREKWAIEKKPILYSRVGINTGDVIVGNMGSEDVFDYTVMGDAVNLASRLEGVNKLYKTTIMCSGATIEQLENRFHIRFLDRIRVVGKAQFVEIFEVIGLASESISDEKNSALSYYQRGRTYYDKREFDSARMMFMQALASDPTDGPSQVFLERCNGHIQKPPPAEWDGVFSLTEK